MRDKQFYVSTDVYRAFWLLSKGDISREQEWAQGNVTNKMRMTPDELADRVLRKHIEENYPQLFEHQKEVDALEKELIEGLTKEPEGGYESSIPKSIQIPKLPKLP